MYDNKGFTIKDLLIRLILIIIFVFLLIWLFPMPNLKPLNNQIFADNIDRMKNVAKTYYTVERLPENINDYKKMTLKEMLKQKLILPLMDSNGNYCSEDKSYVQITKLENEYVIKVYLSCTDTQDYIIEHFGCYDICSNECKMLETTSTTTHTTKRYQTTLKRTTFRSTVAPTTMPTTSQTNHVYEYEYSKNVCENVFDKYTCSAGYELKGDKCVKEGTKYVSYDADKKTVEVRSTDTKDAKVVVNSKTEKVNANKSTQTVYSTINATPSQKTTSKVITKYQTITADKITSYDTKAAIGTTKRTTANYTVVQNYDIITATKYATGYKWSYVSTRTSHNGNEAFVGDNEKLVLVDHWQELACSTCFTTVDVYKYYRYKKEYTGISYSCDAFPGYSLYDTNKCRKATTQSKSCPDSSWKDTGSGCVKEETTYSCSSYGSDYTLDNSAKTCKKAIVSYSCPAGTTQNADKKYCTRPVYGCPSGYSESNGTCVTTTYKCPSNTSTTTYTLAGSKCSVATKKDVYSCPNGTTATTDERYCAKTTTTTEYSCADYPGYTKSGSKCTKTIINYKTTYNCDKYPGSTLSVDKCIKPEKTSDVKDATKEYRLSCKKEYKWSNKTSLEGWTYTGNKRLIK